MSEKLEEKALELLNRFDDLAVQYTPEVIDAAIEVVRFNGLSEIFQGVVGLLVFWFAGRASFRLIRKEMVADIHEFNIGDTVFGIFVGIAAVIGLIEAMSGLLDTWNWVAIFNPKLVLAKQVLGL